MSVVLWLFVPLAVTALGAGTRHLLPARRSRPAPRELVRRALVVLPAGDDQRARLRAVARIVDSDPRADVLIVEPSSGAPAVVDALSSRVSVLRQPGLTSDADGLRAGAARGLQLGYDVIIELSVRQSRLARRLPALLDALDDGAHVAVGSRYVPGGRVIGCSRTRRALSRAANAALRWATGAPVNDLTAHVRAYRREAVERGLLPADGNDRALGVDVVVRCHDAGLQIVEVPVTVAGPQCIAVRTEDGREVLGLAVAARRPRRTAAADRRDRVGASGPRTPVSPRTGAEVRG